MQQVSCLHESVGSGQRVSVCCVCSRSPVYMSLLGVDGVSVCVVCAAGLLLGVDGVSVCVVCAAGLLST